MPTTSQPDPSPREVEHLCCGGELPCQWGTCDVPAGFHAEPHKKNDGCANWRTSLPEPEMTEGEKVYIELAAALAACMMAGHVLDAVAEKFTAVGERIDELTTRTQLSEGMVERAARAVEASLAEGLERERDRLLAALWRIRMAAETASTTDPVWVLPNVIVHLAEGAMGRDRQRAQDLASAIPSEVES